MARRFENMADVEAFTTVIEKGSMTEGACRTLYHATGDQPRR